MKAKDAKIIFFGTPDFACKTLRGLFNAGYNIVGVITQPDRPIGRKQKLQKTPVKILAEELKIPILELSNLDFSDVNLGVLFSYGEIVSNEILEMFEFGILNIHPSLLPKYRGSSPVQSAILNNDSKTGVSIIKLDEKMDHGPIIAQEELKIDKDITADKLLGKLAQAGTDLLIKKLPNYLAEKIKPRKQNDSLATYTKQLKREDGLIIWQKSANEIMRQFRAFYPWPGVFTHWQKKRLKIVKLGEFKGNFNQKLIPGTVFLTPEKQMAAACKDRAVILEKIQLEGKKEMTIPEFLSGYKDVVGDILG